MVALAGQFEPGYRLVDGSELNLRRLTTQTGVVVGSAGPPSVFASDQPNPTTGTVDVVQLAQTNTNYGYGAVAQHYIATFICYLPGVWKSFYPGATQP